MDFLNKFRIPTLLGIGIIIFGIATGSLLVMRGRSVTSKAFSDTTLENITLSNIADDSVTISWHTSSAVPSFVTYGINNPTESTALDDRDNQGPQARLLHYVTIKNLLPKTNYQYKIIAGKTASENLNFITATPLNFQTGLRPIIGSVLKDGKPLNEAVIHLSIPKATTQSSLIKSNGNFLIPISQIRKDNLSEGFSPQEDTVAKLTILSTSGQATVVFPLRKFESGLPPISLGENLDLTLLEESKLDNIDYDINADGSINSADNAIILQNLGKNPKNLKADLDKNGIVDQRDLDLLIKQIQ